MFACSKLKIMKPTSIKIVLILFSFLLIESCKKDDDSEVIVDFKAENRKSLGLSAEDILSSNNYSKITVEFVYFGLYRPTDLTISNFRDFLSARLNKPGGIIISETRIPEAEGSPFTTQELIAIEDENRTVYTSGDTIAVYVFFANGVSSNDTDTRVTLGTAYLNTSIVLYEKTLQTLAASNPSLELSTIETTTLQHEFGHILGLVNLLDDDIHANHMDTGHPKHCIIEDCLMYFESNNRSQVLERFSGRVAIPELDPLCIADLQAKGGL
ncbi:MAG: hypothetical protein ACI9OS_000116 [Ulvibacter sp.]|jgi:hypothetical protein